MFQWCRPQCPVDRVAKDWIESRLGWLGQQFGLDAFVRRSVILPTRAFFPDPYLVSDESVRLLLDRVCYYMDANPTLVELELFTDRLPLWLVNNRGEPLPGAVGIYDEHGSKTVIRLETSQLDDPMSLVGTMAHEIGHLRLLGERRISDDAFDHELLTDLCVVFYGLGIFLANSPRAWVSQFTTWPGTNLRKPEYMTHEMFGYALAHSAWLRNERRPKWCRYLRMHARSSFKRGLRFLQETGDSKFRPQRTP